MDKIIFSHSRSRFSDIRHNREEKMIAICIPCQLEKDQYLLIQYFLSQQETHYDYQGRPWLTRGPVRGMEWGPPRSVCNGVTGGGGGCSIPFVAGRGARCDRTSCTAQRTALMIMRYEMKICVYLSLCFSAGHRKTRPLQPRLRLLVRVGVASHRLISRSGIS